MKDLKSYINYLESRNRLIKVNDKVDPELEITAFTDKANKENVYESKTLLFNDVKGYGMPVVTNLFGSMSSLLEMFSSTYANELLYNLSSMKSQGAKFSLVRGAKMMVDSKPKYIESQLSKYQKFPNLDHIPQLKQGIAQRRQRTLLIFQDR